MSDLSKTIKIKHDGEIRKLKEINNYDDFLESIRHKMKIDPEEFELCYVDPEGDEVHISTSQDFDECLRVMNSKVPKIILKRIESSDAGLGDSFSHIQMTVSTVDRPVRRQTQSKPSQAEEEGNKNPEVEEEKEDRIQPVKEYLEQIDIDSSDSHKGMQTEQSHAPESDEKGTYTKIDGVLDNSNSVQTQSILNQHASTDVINLVENFDRNLGTDSLLTEEKGNQREVLFSESANDPIMPEVNHQSINTNLFGSCDQKDQSVHVEEPKVEVNIEANLAELVKKHMQELTPMLLDECHKYIRQHLSENQPKVDKSQAVHDATCVNCDAHPIFGTRYECIHCDAYTLCSNCEEFVDHEHPMLKLKTSEALFQYLMYLKENKNSVSKLGESISRIINSDKASNADDEINVDIESEPDMEPLVKDEESHGEPVEYPEMVKRSVMLEYKPFSDHYIQKLKVKVISPENILHTVSKHSEHYNIEFVLSNDDYEGNTRWPIYSTISCDEPNSAEIITATMTSKEIRPGMSATLTAKMRTPPKTGLAFYIFHMIDEYGRKFGDPFAFKVKVIDVPILDINDVPELEPEGSAFEEPHEAEKLYPHALKQLSEMGIEINERIKDLMVQFKGRLEEIFEQI